MDWKIAVLFLTVLLVTLLVNWNRLNGQVLAIGGLNLKVEGAKKAGVKYVLCPKENKDDLEKIRNSKHPPEDEDARTQGAGNNQFRSQPCGKRHDKSETNTIFNDFNLPFQPPWPLQRTLYGLYLHLNLSVLNLPPWVWKAFIPFDDCQTERGKRQRWNTLPVSRT